MLLKLTFTELGSTILFFLPKSTSNKAKTFLTVQLLQWNNRYPILQQQTIKYIKYINVLNIFYSAIEYFLYLYFKEIMII